MGVVYNSIQIEAPLETIWNILSVPEDLEKYDPTVKRSYLVSDIKTGLNTKRKVEMLDGKNWFEETITECQYQQALRYELTACSFPIHNLSHSYTFESNGNTTTVKQVMSYTVKFGIFGKLLDFLFIQKQTNSGIQKFFAGLKQHAESKWPITKP